MADPRPTPDRTLGVATTWCEYNAQSGTGPGMGVAQLTRNGKLPRWVVLKAAGALVCKDAFEQDASLTGLPSGYKHEGAVSAIDATQAVDLVIYW